MTTLNIHQRLHAAMGEVDYVQKERKQGMRYSIVSHDAVTAKVRPILHKHGVVYYPIALARSQSGNRTEVELSLRFASIDDPKDCIDVPSLGYGIDDQDKGPGKAISYAVKYALLKALGLETGDDPDEEQDVKHKTSANGKSTGLVEDEEWHTEAWKDWATGVEAEKWFKAFRHDLHTLTAIKAVDGFIASNKKYLGALYEYAPDRYTKASDQIDLVRGSLRARHPMQAG